MLLKIQFGLTSVNYIYFKRGHEDPGSQSQRLDSGVAPSGNRHTSIHAAPDIYHVTPAPWFKKQELIFDGKMADKLSSSNKHCFLHTWHRNLKQAVKVPMETTDTDLITLLSFASVLLLNSN